MGSRLCIALRRHFVSMNTNNNIPVEMVDLYATNICSGSTNYGLRCYEALRGFFAYETNNLYNGRFQQY